MKARKSSRYTIFATGAYRTSRGMQRDVDLYDLSQGGCRVQDEQRILRLGEYVRFFLAGTGPHMAEVAWRQADSVGLAFHRPLPERVFQALIRSDWAGAREAYESVTVMRGARRVL